MIRKKLTQQELFDKLHQTCQEIEKLRKKYSTKRSTGLKIAQRILYKKHKVFIPFEYHNSSNKFEFWKLIKSLLNKAYLQAIISERLSGMQPEKSIVCVCQICRNPIKLGEVVIRYAYGKFTKDEIGGIGFEEPQSTNTLGYAHIDCLQEKENGHNQKSKV